jgi:hypothetical protein
MSRNGLLVEILMVEVKSTNGRVDCRDSGGPHRCYR